MTVNSQHSRRFTSDSDAHAERHSLESGYQPQRALDWYVVTCLTFKKDAMPCSPSSRPCPLFCKSKRYLHENHNCLPPRMSAPDLNNCRIDHKTDIPPHSLQKWMPAFQGNDLHKLKFKDETCPGLISNTMHKDHDASYFA